MRDKDELNRFLIENADVRGLLVQLDDTWLEAVSYTHLTLPTILLV